MVLVSSGRTEGSSESLGSEGTRLPFIRGVGPRWCMCTHTNYKEVNSNRVASSGERQLVQEQHTSHQGTKTLGHEKTVYNLCTHTYSKGKIY